MCAGCGGSADAPPATKPASGPLAQVRPSGRPPGVDPDDDIPVAPPPRLATGSARASTPSTARPPGAESDDAPPIAAAPPLRAQPKPGRVSALPPGAEPDEAPPAEVPLITRARVKELQNAMAPDELPSAPGGAAPQPVAKPELPTDLAQWAADDFRLARKKRERRLVQAVRQLGSGNKLNPDAEANARLLGELLKSTEASAEVAGPTKPAGADDSELPVTAQTGAMPGLAQAIVETLGVSSSVEARAVLKHILLGTQPSDADDHALTSSALRALVNHPDEENQRILAAVLTVPDSIRPAGRGQVTADQLQDECLRLVRPIATADFRLLVAQRAGRGTSSGAGRRRLMAFLLAAEPANIGAQVELLVAGQVDAAALSGLDRQLGQTCQQVLDRLLRAAPAELTGSGDGRSAPHTSAEESPSREMTLGDAIQWAEQLWRRDFSQSLVPRVEALAGGAADVPLLTLAANLPTGSARAALTQHWEKSWAEDFTSPDGSVPISGATSDPGLIVVLKQLPREAASAKPTAQARHDAEAIQKPRTKVGGQPESSQAQRAANEQLAKHATLVASENFVRLLNQRLAKAAQLQLGAGFAGRGAAVKPVSSIEEFDSLLESADKTKFPQAVAKPPSDSLPPELGLSMQPGARVQAAYRMNWPDDFHDQMPANTATSLAIYFQRLECVGEANSVAGFYQRQLSRSSLRTIENGRWVDSLAKLDDGRLRSIDVTITRLDAGAQADRPAVQRCAVDLLVVEVPDPHESHADH
jgi:hypothetical protein